jgi:dTMP kinase
MAGEQGVHGAVCEGTAVPGPGRLITIEGLDGAGKTTLAAGLADEFPRLLLLREPGGVALAERLLDRFLDSSLAYQGAGRELGVDAIRAVNLFGTGGLIPDLTLLLRIDPAAGRARLAARGEAPDRLESEPEAFFARVAEAYDTLAAAEPDRVVVLDADLPSDEVLAAAAEAVGRVLA